MRSVLARRRTRRFLAELDAELGAVPDAVVQDVTRAFDEADARLAQSTGARKARREPERSWRLLARRDTVDRDDL